MILKKDILFLLEDLETSFNGSTALTSTRYAKLSVLELCGWLEESFDKIARRCVKRKINTPPYTDVLNSIISKNHGFTYKNHFRKMMMSIIGIVEMQKIEQELTHSGEIFILQSTLYTLSIERNKAAHTTMVGAMSTFQAPSVTTNQLKILYPILRKLYSKAVRIN